MLTGWSVCFFTIDERISDQLIRKGCNIPDTDIVGQETNGHRINSIQRAGRAPRAAGRTGVLFLLVEKSNYDADLDKVCENDRKSQAKKPYDNHRIIPKRKTKDYAVKGGILRGGCGGLTHGVADGIDVPVDVSSNDKGVYDLVQSTTCRCGVLTKIYRNEKASKR